MSNKNMSAVEVSHSNHSLTPFPLPLPAESGLTEKNSKPADTSYLDLDAENECYICGSDVLIGASETVETEIIPALEIDSTNAVLNPNSYQLECLPTENAFLNLPSEEIHDENSLVSDTSHEILTSPLDPEGTILDNSLQIMVDIPLDEVEKNSSKSKRTKKRRIKKEVPEEVEIKIIGQRGRKPHFGKNCKPTCSICDAEFTNTASLRTHMLVHSGERPFKCDLCDKSFTRNTVLRIHRRLHTGEKPYICKLCPSGFVTKEALARHETKDHPSDLKADEQKEKPTHSCQICEKVLCSKYSLRAHMNVHLLRDNGIEKAGVECSFCKKSFTCRYTLQRHVFEKHNRRGIITCNICEQNFASKWEHSKHQESHSTSKKYQCDECSQTFEKQYQLLYHLQIHEAKKKSRITCHLCNKKYNSRESFLNHIRSYVESERYIYSCPQCQVSFSEPRQLKMHLNETHKLPVISDLNYCDICKLDANDGTEYYEHLFKKHDSVDILCRECGVTFKSRRQYDEHFVAHFS